MVMTPHSGRWVPTYWMQYLSDQIMIKIIFLLFRNQREEDLRENHPFFDTPLFAVPRESKFRKVCQLIVYARYDARLKDPLTGKERKVQYKRMQ